jgi:hypothetical protein
VNSARQNRRYIETQLYRLLFNQGRDGNAEK